MKKSLITPVVSAEDQATVDSIFGMVQEHMGFIPDGLRLYSISPPLLQSFIGNVGYFMQHTRLSQPLLAMIRYLVSSGEGCQFCIDFNAAILLNLGITQEQLEAAQSSPEQAPLSSDEKHLLSIALSAINHPETVSRQDIDLAIEQGYSERDVFDVVAIAANNKAFTHVLRTFKIEQQGTFA